MQNFELSFLLSYFVFETFNNSTIHCQIYHLNALFGIISKAIICDCFIVTGSHVENDFHEGHHSLNSKQKQDKLKGAELHRPLMG